MNQTIRDLAHHRMVLRERELLILKCVGSVLNESCPFGMPDRQGLEAVQTLWHRKPCPNKWQVKAYYGGTAAEH